MTTEERKIKIGGGVRDSNIIVGNNNVVVLPEGRTMLNLEQYLKALRSACDGVPYVHLLSHFGINFSLAEMYVPQVIEAGGKKAEREEITAIIHRAKMSIVVGRPGAGKSTWLYRTVHDVAESFLKYVHNSAWHPAMGVEKPLIPAFVRLRDLNGRDGTIHGMFKEAIESFLLTNGELPDDYLTRWPQEYGAEGWLVACDGFDEVTTGELRGQVMAYLARLAQNGYTVLLTSRYTPDLFWRPAKDAESEKKLKSRVYELRIFEKADAERFLWQWLPQPVSDRPDKVLREIEGIADVFITNPLLLTIAAIVYRFEGALPQHRWQLYERSVNIFLEERASELDLHLEKERISTSFLLQQVAVLMFPRFTENERDLMHTLGKWMYAKGLASREVFIEKSRQWLKALAHHSGVLFAKGDQYEFLHATFQEYLIACALQRELTLEEAENFGQAQLGDSTLEFLVEMIDTVKNEYEEVLWRWVYEAKGMDESQVDYTAGNALTLLAKLRENDLSGVDLSGLVLKGVNLHGTKMNRADLRNTRLLEGQLEDVILAEALLHDMVIDGTTIGKIRLESESNRFLYGEKLKSELLASSVRVKSAKFTERGMYWGGGCFIGTMRVALASGEERPISEIRDGDEVLAYDDLSGKVVREWVREVMVGEKQNLVVINDGVLILTPTQPVKTVEHGWRRANELGIGDHLVGLERTTKVQSLEKVTGRFEVFHLLIEDAHTFFVNEILVHNYKVWFLGG